MFKNILLILVIFLSAINISAEKTDKIIKNERSDDTRPNIVWITFEDISPQWGCYGDKQAVTPNLDKLAAEGMRFDNAYSISGVCAPSRSSLITGMYTQSIYTHHMRSRASLPEHIKCFTAYLREAGYYCTNNVKNDYNFQTPDNAWDENSREADWNKRKQPFFSVFNFTQSHESKIGTDPEKLVNILEELGEERQGPATINIPPIYPDTPLMRQQWAHYYDLMTIVDRRAGEILDKLEKDGLAENTVVFAFGDHGMGLPRAKRWLYDTGIKVPLVVRWPDKIKKNSSTNKLVSFVDFAPTVLNLAGLDIPEHLQGQSFIDENTSNRSYIYAGRDRMDERYDIIRAVKDERFKYIRNYMPKIPYDEYIYYPEHHIVMPELRRALKENLLNMEQKLYFRQEKPLEELYDTLNDPYELHNILEDIPNPKILTRLQAAMDSWMEEINDPALVPEIMLPYWPKMVEDYKEPVISYTIPGKSQIGQVFGNSSYVWLDKLNTGKPLQRIEAMRAFTLADGDIASILRRGLIDPLAPIAYWAAIGMGEKKIREPESLAALRSTLYHKDDAVKIAAAYALAQLNFEDEVAPVLIKLSKSENPFIRHQVALTLESFPVKSGAVMKQLYEMTKDKYTYARQVALHASDIK